MSAKTASPEIAFYYPGHLWYRPDWIKTLLLFFDGIGLLVPEYKKNEVERFYPELAGPLEDKGLLRYLVADEIVDAEATKQLSDSILHLIEIGAFDHLQKNSGAFHELSMSRMGYAGDSKLAEKVFKKLKKRGLARDSEDSVSVPLHPLVRYTFLTLLAQILKTQGRRLGLDLIPATDNELVVRSLSELLNVPSIPSAGNVIAFDLQAVSLNLAAIPLDEVLAFRKENSEAYKAYARSARSFARQLSLLDVNDRQAAFEERQEELADMANDLRRRSRRAWRAPASFSLALTGATWTYLYGEDLVGALLAAGSAAIGGALPETSQADAFTYLFAAARQFPE